MLDNRLYDLETFKSTVGLLFGAWMNETDYANAHDGARAFDEAHEYLRPYWSYHELDCWASLEGVYDKWFLDNGGTVVRR